MIHCQGNFKILKKNNFTSSLTRVPKTNFLLWLFGISTSIKKLNKKKIINFCETKIKKGVLRLSPKNGCSRRAHDPGRVRSKGWHRLSY